MVAGGAAALHFYHRIDEEIRCHIESKIAQHYAPAGLTVSLRSTQRIDGKGIKVTDLRIVEADNHGPQAELLRIDEMFIECSTDWKDLATAQPEVRRVTFRRPTFRFMRRPDGTFSAARLLPLPQFSKHSPEVIVEGGVIELSDSLKPGASPVTLRDLNVTLAPTPGDQPGGLPHVRQVRGRLTGDHLRRLEFQGRVDGVTPGCNITGRAEGVELSPDWCASLSGAVSTKLDRLSQLRGQTNLNFTLGYDPASATPLCFDLTGHLTQGRWEDPGLPYPLTDIQAAVHLDNNGFTVNDLTARSGQATLRMSCHGAGFNASTPLAMTAAIRGLDLNQSLMNILSESWKEQWRKYSPAGQINADVQLDYDGRVWRPTLAVQCLDVAFTHHKFQYRLEHCQGDLNLKNDVLTLGMTAYSGSGPVRLAAEITHPFTGGPGWFTAEADQVQIDEPIVAALPPKPQEVLRSLEPTGAVGVYARLWRDQPNGPLHQHYVIEPKRCAMRYQKFPYPLTNVCGKITMLDGVWKISDCVGYHNAAIVTCNGTLEPGLQGNELVLNFVGKDVALEDELLLALNPDVQKVWLGLQPRGAVDFSATVGYSLEQRRSTVQVRVNPKPNGTSIEPIQFPYRLDWLTGSLLYRDGHVTLVDCKADHGRGAVNVSTAGQCEFQNNGRWAMHFTGLTIDRINPLERELIQALPERLRKAIVALNPTAPFNLRGSLSFEHDGLPEHPLKIGWNVRLGLHQATLQCGDVPLNNITGEMTLAGSFDGRQVHSRGELHLDSANYKDVFFSDIRGPMWIEDGRILFGSAIEPRSFRPGQEMPTGPIMPVTAGVVGGTLRGGGWVLLGAEPTYGLGLELTNADLARCAQELGTGRHKLSGRVALATAALTGSGHSRNNLRGEGEIHIADAYVYELPGMIKLLKLLGFRPPDNNAFSSMDINYRIGGEHIYFDRLDLNGDAISLSGRGEMNFQTDVQLTFHARLGRGEFVLPIVTPVLRGASQQIMLIRATGPMQNPEITKEVLPAVNQVLQQIQGEPSSRR